MNLPSTNVKPVTRLSAEAASPSPVREICSAPKISATKAWFLRSSNTAVAVPFKRVPVATTSSIKSSSSWLCAIALGVKASEANTAIVSCFKGKLLLAWFIVTSLAAYPSSDKLYSWNANALPNILGNAFVSFFWTVLTFSLRIKDLPSSLLSSRYQHL